MQFYFTSVSTVKFGVEKSVSKKSDTSNAFVNNDFIDEDEDSAETELIPNHVLAVTQTLFSQFNFDLSEPIIFHSLNRIQPAVTVKFNQFICIWRI